MKKDLLARREEIEGWLSNSPDRLEIENVWSTIRQGQRFDQDRFSRPDATPLDEQELDIYAYMVAGCVGEFWTRLCEKKIPGFASLDPAKMTDLGIRFGKGLQFVNILRDRHADAQRRIESMCQQRDFTRCSPSSCAPARSAAVRRALRNYRLRVACALPLYLATKHSTWSRKSACIRG